MKFITSRTIVQLVFVGLIAYVGLRHIVVGGGPTGAPSICSYCPLGGAVTSYSYFTDGTFIWKTHMTSLIVLGGVLLTTLVTGAFCGWICPFGAVQEWLRKAGRRVRFLHRLEIPGVLDRVLRYARFVVLFLVMYGTISYGYLVFEKYDPFKNFFHFRMEGTWPWVLFGLTIGLSLVIDRWFCKYLCPMAAILQPFMALSPFRVAKSQELCTSCGKCQSTCVVPRSLGPGRDGQIAMGYCTRCLDCIDDCPVPNTLEVHLGGSSRWRNAREEKQAA